MSSESNHYEVLGISASADTDAIKRAYREQIRRFHPDALVGQMAKARQAGDLSAIRRLEKQIEEAKRKTQQINVAYGVLSDPAKKHAYDLQNAGVPAQRGSIYHDSDPYRAGPYAARNATSTSRARPSAPPRPATDERFPYALFGILGGGLLLVFGLLVAWGALPAPEDGLPVINDGRISAQDLQATTTLREATRIAWTQAALLPTATLRSIEGEVTTANYFFDQGEFRLAEELFSNAIDRGYVRAEAFYRRGMAVINMQRESDYGQALADLTRAIQLAPEQADAYLQRALLAHTMWQRSRADALLQQIRDDAAAFARLGGSSATLDAVLTSLP
jgi:tetratricopeptide (TPR) repeat protein